MIIDIILDRRLGSIYNPKQLYDYATSEMYVDNYSSIAQALDCLDNETIQKELCRYIDMENYNPEIKDYINSVNWIITKTEEHLIEKINTKNIEIYNVDENKNMELLETIENLNFVGLSKDNYCFKSNTNRGLGLSFTELTLLNYCGGIVDNNNNKYYKLS